MRFYHSILIILIVPVILGMGMRGGELGSSVPEPEDNYAATVVDSQGISTQVSRISFDGKTFVSGYRGSALVTIPFDKIARLEIAGLDEKGRVSIAIHLKKGEPITLTARGDVPCYGSADFGNFQIDIKDVRSVEILGLLHKEKM